MSKTKEEYIRKVECYFVGGTEEYWRVELYVRTTKYDEHRFDSDTVQRYEEKRVGIWPFKKIIDVARSDEQMEEVVERFTKESIQKHRVEQQRIKEAQSRSRKLSGFVAEKKKP